MMIRVWVGGEKGLVEACDQPTLNMHCNNTITFSSQSIIGYKFQYALASRLEILGDKCFIDWNAPWGVPKNNRRLRPEASCVATSHQHRPCWRTNCTNCAMQ